MLFNVVSRKTLPNPRSWRCNYIFSRSYIVLAPAFRSPSLFLSLFCFVIMGIEIQLSSFSCRYSVVPFHTVPGFSRKNTGDSITNSMDVSWSRLWEMVDRGLECCSPWDLRGLNITTQQQQHIQLSQKHLLYALFLWVVLASVVKISWSRMEGFSSVLSILVHRIIHLS